MNMKRLFIISGFLLIALGFVFAEDFTGQTVVIEPPNVDSLTNLSKSERDSIQAGIKSNLERNLDDYLLMQVTDNAEEIAKLQEIQRRQSESNAYEDSFGPELGSFKRAFYSVQARVLKTGSNYSVSIRFTNIATGITTSAQSKNYSKIENLYSSPGAVDDATLDLCDRLRISLAPLQRQKLEKGSIDWSTDKKLEEQQIQIATMKKKMEELQKQRAAISSSDLGKTEEARIQSQIENLQRKQAEAQARAERLQRDKELQEAEAARNSERDAKTRDRIIQEQRDSAAAVANMKSQQTSSESIYQYYRLLEDKKQVLLEVQQNINNEIENRNKERDAEIKEARNSIENAPYRAFELSEGKPVPEVTAERKARADEKEKEIRNRVAAETKEWQAMQEKQKSVIVSDILDGYEALEDEIFVFNSITNENEVQYIIEDFDRKKMGWPLAVYIYSEGNWIGAVQTVIPYEQLYSASEGVAAPTTGEEFADAVDRYQSHFVQKDNFVYFEVTCNAYPDTGKDSVPSRYGFRIEKLTVYLTKNNAVLLAQDKFDYVQGKFSQSWWYTFIKEKKDVSSLIAAELAAREAEREKIRKAYEAEIARQEREERLKRAEEAAKARAEAAAKKKAENKEKFIASQDGRSGIFLSVGMEDYAFHPGLIVDLTALVTMPLPYIFAGAQVSFSDHFYDKEQHRDSMYYELAVLMPSKRMIGEHYYFRAIAEGGATITLFRWLRPYVMLGAGYYRCFYGADGVIYEQDPRYGSGGVLAQGFCMGMQTGFDVKIKKFSFGFGYRLQIDFGSGAKDEYILATLGWKLW